MTAYRAEHPDLAPNKIEDLFQVQGGRIANVLSEPGAPERMREQERTFSNAATVREEQGVLSSTTIQQFEQSIANISNIANTLATPTLSGLDAAFKTLNTGLLGINDFLKQHPLAAEVGGYVMDAALVGVAVGVGGQILNFVKGGFSALGLGGAGAGAAGAGAGAGALG
ncbi:MAG TPA: hypothetical protein VGC62_16680, partial [Pseudomonas sp.]